MTDAPTAANGNGKHDEDEPLLDLSTILKRPTVKIVSKEHPEGKLYELASHDDFGIIEQHRLKADVDSYDKLWEKEDLTDTERERLKELLDRMFEKVLDAPKTIKAQIGDHQRAQIVRAFHYAPAVTAARERELREQEQEQDGDPLTTAS